MNLSHRTLTVLSMAAALSASAGAEAAIWYVRTGATGNGTTWALAFGNLQAALNVAQPGDSVYIGAGTYKPSLERETGTPRSRTFALRGGVQYLGGFPAAGGTLAQRNAAANVTTLSGDINGNDTATFGNTSENCFHVVYLNGAQAGTMLDGFTIRGGYANDTENFDYAAGGGVKLSGSMSGTPVIRGCMIRNNHAENQGGGIEGGHVVVVRSTIYNNRTGVMGEGGGANLGSSQFICCSFIGNLALHGGGLKQGTTGMTLLNCHFSGNRATAASSSDAGFGGGAMLLGDSGTAVTSCTFAGNVATALTGVDQVDSQGGGIWLGSGGAAKVYNTILWDNTRYHVTTVVTAVQDQAAQLYAVAQMPILSWDIIQGLGAGIGTSNLSTSPQFVGAKGADLTYGTLDDNPAVLVTSPAVDSASTDVIPGDAFDVDGNGITNEPTPVDVLGNDRFVDQPSVANTGPGGLATDRGAYEVPNSCYANCDASTSAPLLNVLDFNCFLNRFAAGDTYANCDASSVAPVLNVLDFNCFLNRFAAGCP